MIPIILLIILQYNKSINSFLSLLTENTANFLSKSQVQLLRYKKNQYTYDLH